jgi:tetratricopeptide (TPR) repeat protein
VQEITLSSAEEAGALPSHLISSVGSKAPLAYVSSSSLPNAQHSVQINLLRMPSWSQQLDQMVQNGSYEDALPLLESIEDVLLPDKAKRRDQLRALNALARFFRGDYDFAIDAFIELDLNPAKVICLYPERISGKLYKDEAHREEVFGGRKADKAISEEPSKTDDASSQHQVELPVSASPAQAHFRWPAYRRAAREDDAASVRSASSAATHLRQSSNREQPFRASIVDEEQEFKRSVEVLLRYLADRRQKVNKAVATLKPSVRPSPSSAIEVGTVDELFDMPDGSLLKLKPLQLHRVAQVVDTALFRCYLAIRPTLLGSLCRLENWCVVEEVEALLKEANVCLPNALFKSNVV